MLMEYEDDSQSMRSYLFIDGDPPLGIGRETLNVWSWLQWGERVNNSLMMLNNVLVTPVRRRIKHETTPTDTDAPISNEEQSSKTFKN